LVNGGTMLLQQYGVLAIVVGQVGWLFVGH